MDKILTVSDVAAILQVQPITVREMFREKRLRAFKIGKAWRTTHQMLQEDIQTLARGERPPALVHPAKEEEAGPNEQAPSKAAPRKKADKAAPAADKPAVGEDAGNAAEAPPAASQDYLF